MMHELLLRRELAATACILSRHSVPQTIGGETVFCGTASGVRSGGNRVQQENCELLEVT